MNTYIINGITYKGNNIVISNNKVIIDGNDMTPDCKEINVVINGDADNIQADKVTVTGKVGSINAQSGLVEVNGDIFGSVQTMSGSVNCSGDIHGSVSTMSGNINGKQS